MPPVHYKISGFSRHRVILLLRKLLWVQVLPELPHIALWKFGLGELSEKKNVSVLAGAITPNNKVFVSNPGGTAYFTSIHKAATS